MKQNHMYLLCCLQTLQSLDVTYDPFKIPYSKRQQYPETYRLEKTDIRNLLEVAKYIIYISSMHINKVQTRSEQDLLSKYLYRFRYFYNFSKSKQLQCQTMVQSNSSTLKINMIALETLFLLAKY